MWLGAEIGFALWGLFTLFVGAAKIAPHPMVNGTKARLLGLIAMLPLGIGYLAGTLVGVIGQQNRWSEDEFNIALNYLHYGEISFFILICIALFLLAKRWGKSSGQEISEDTD